MRYPGITNYEKYEQLLEIGYLGSKQAEYLFGYFFPYGPEYYSVSATFIARNSGTFPNSFMYLNACSSATDLDVSPIQHLISKSKVGAILGFDTTVQPSYAGRITKSLFFHLINGDTIQEAKERAEKEVSVLWNGINLGVKLILKGNGNLRMRDSVGGIYGGSFESGWIEYSSGDVYVFSHDHFTGTAVGGTVFPDGDHIAYLNLRHVFSPPYFYKQFQIPGDKKKLSFYYAIENNKVYGQGNDSSCELGMKATLKDEKGNETEILDINLNKISSKFMTSQECHYLFIDSKYIVCNDSYFTPWTKVEFPIEPYAVNHEKVTLDFRYYSGNNRSGCGPNAYVYIDDVKLE